MRRERVACTRRGRISYLPSFFGTLFSASSVASRAISLVKGNSHSANLPKGSYITIISMWRITIEPIGEWHNSR